MEPEYKCLNELENALTELMRCIVPEGSGKSRPYRIQGEIGKALRHGTLARRKANNPAKYYEEAMRYHGRLK